MTGEDDEDDLFLYCGFIGAGFFLLSDEDDDSHLFGLTIGLAFYYTGFLPSELESDEICQFTLGICFYYLSF